MKSKFSPVVRVRKQALEIAQNKVAIARANVARLESLVKDAQDELNRYETPRSGNINELKQSLEILRIMNDDLARLKAGVNIAKSELSHFLHQYKNANLEYEKMKYLEQEDINFMLKKEKHAQEVALNEFAVMKFAQGLNRDD